jgi:hypothetical protein
LSSPDDSTFLVARLVEAYDLLGVEILPVGSLKNLFLGHTPEKIMPSQKNIYILLPRIGCPKIPFMMIFAIKTAKL